MIEIDPRWYLPADYQAVWTDSAASDPATPELRDGDARSREIAHASPPDDTPQAKRVPLGAAA